MNRNNKNDYNNNRNNNLMTRRISNENDFNNIFGSSSGNMQDKKKDIFGTD